MQTARLSVFTILVLALALSGVARSDPPIEALPADIETPGYAPGRVPFHPGQQLFYEVSWERIPVAYARISLRLDPEHSHEWLGEASVSTNRVVDVLYRLRAYMREEVPPRTMASDAVFIHNNENGRQTDYTVTFHRADGIVETTRRKHDETEVKRFLANHPLGPIGASLLAISQPIKVGGSMTEDVFATTDRFVVQFRVADREPIHWGADDVEAFRVIPSILYLSNPKNHYKVRQVVIWVSADEPHVPLRIEADTFVGRIFVELSSGTDGRR
jgi:Protein of unknown function (DUF3108)